MRIFVFLILSLPFIAGFSKLKKSDFLLVNVETELKEKVVLEERMVIVFLSPECPLCINYTKTLNDLYSRYSLSGIRFIGVFSGAYADRDSINSFASRYKITFPLYMDKQKKLSGYLQATITPEVFLTDENGKIVYQGLIDDWVYAPGKLKPVITEFYLRDALQALLNNEYPALIQTTAIGCFIE